MSNQRIIAQMVGRNEEGRFLEDVLKRLSSQVDEIVFTDDCSEDNTAKIAAEYAHVYKTPEPTFKLKPRKGEKVNFRSLWHNLFLLKSN